MRRRLGSLALLAAASCGRVGYDPADPDAAGPPDAAGDALAVPPDAMVPGGMVVVPVTPGLFDFQPDAANVTLPWKQVSLTRSFFLDQHEVTVGRFAAWVTAGQPVPCATGTCPLDPTGHYSAMVWHASWNARAQINDFATPCSSPWAINGSTYPVGDPQLPMNCVNWAQAVAFCAWDGQKRLPTQVEWNYEARAGGDHRSYVWGDEPPDCAHATFDSPTMAYCRFPVPVGSAPLGASVHGALDLSGSIWEWGWDGSSLASFGVTADEVPAGSVDFTGIDVGGTADAQRVLFGGEWGQPLADLSLVGGSGHGPGVAWGGDSQLSTIGFRCARTAPR